MVTALYPRATPLYPADADLPMAMPEPLPAALVWVARYPIEIVSAYGDDAPLPSATELLPAARVLAPNRSELLPAPGSVIVPEFMIALPVTCRL